MTEEDTEDRNNWKLENPLWRLLMGKAERRRRMSFSSGWNVCCKIKFFIIMSVPKLRRCKSNTPTGTMVFIECSRVYLLNWRIHQGHIISPFHSGYLR